MKVAMDIDCVKMKNEIQTRLNRIYAGLSDEEVRARMKSRLATSDSPVARLWRSLQKPAAKSK